MLETLLTIALAAAPPVFNDRGETIAAPLSDRVVHYEIKANLDPVDNVLTGAETLTWRNRSAVPQHTLWFHLYWNAFKNDRSTFYMDSRRMGGVRDESASSSSYPDRKVDEWGYVDVVEMAVHGGASVLESLKYQHPDDDNVQDETVFTVELPDGVAAGATVTLDIKWSARIPKIVERAGREKDYYLFGQWFPKIGVLEVPGERGATTPRWNCHQYHATTEFYADFGTYDVRVTAPSRFVVGATGVLLEKIEQPGSTTFHFHQDDVHDFAWTAWPEFQVVQDTFDEPDLPKVAITLLLAPRHEASRAQYLASIKASLKHYGEWWLPWPYPHLTIVDPPTDAVASGGMEYPTFITSVSRHQPGEPKDYLVWQVTAHEFGHNYWYGIVASNEFEEAWLDEGINTYGTSKLLGTEGVLRDFKVGPPSFLRWWLPGLPSSSEAEYINNVSSHSLSSPVIQEAWKYRNQLDYGANSYNRTGANLMALEKVVGAETMSRIMRKYVERWKFRHPRSEDFFAVAEEESHQDLHWFWADFFRGTGQLDYAVDRLECTRHHPAEQKGIFGSSSARQTLEPAPKHGKDEPGEFARCQVDVSRIGDIELPVKLHVTFEDGTTTEESWNGVGRWHTWTYERPMPTGEVREAALDANGALALDMTPSNNSRTRKRNTAHAISIFGFFTYLEQLLGSLASVLA